jgi:hypothetical protein
MQRPKLIAAALAAALAAPPALANPDVEKLRAEFEQKLRALQESYETRLQEMETRLAKTEGQARSAERIAGEAARTPASQSAFNPEISLILQGRYHNAKGDGHIAGFLPAGHDHGGGKGFSLDASELTLGASIDPYFRGFANFTVAGGEIETEEAWVQTTALGHGFTAKLGRYLSGIGYANERHPHAWDFANQNLAYAAMLGEHYLQDGVQLRWLAPTPLFLQFGAELGQGADWGDRNRLGSHALFAHLGDDVGDSHSWRAGLSWLRAKAGGRKGHWDDAAGVEAETLFSGTSKYWIADFVWKWAPGGNAKYRNFKFQGEYLKRNESGSLACADNTAAGGACTGLTDGYRARQSGWYAQGVYQFMPRWRAGYRYDRLNVGTLDFGAGYTGIFSRPDHTPDRHTFMVDYNPSEFSRFRLQLARDRGKQGLTDNQVTLQYIHSLGPHGAHKF